MFYRLVQNCIGGNCNPFIKIRFIIENTLFISRNEHMNKYEIENILQTKPKKSARELFLQGRCKIFRAGKSHRSPALQGRWFQMLTSSPDQVQ